MLGILKIKDPISQEQAEGIRRALRDGSKQANSVLVSSGIDFEFIPTARKIILKDRVEHLRNNRMLIRLNYSSHFKIRVNNEEGC